MDAYDLRVHVLKVKIWANFKFKVEHSNDNDILCVNKSTDHYYIRVKELL